MVCKKIIDVLGSRRSCVAEIAYLNGRRRLAKIPIRQSAVKPIKSIKISTSDDLIRFAI